MRDVSGSVESPAQVIVAASTAAAALANFRTHFFLSQRCLVIEVHHTSVLPLVLATVPEDINSRREGGGGGGSTGY